MDNTSSIVSAPQNQLSALELELENLVEVVSQMSFRAGQILQTIRDEKLYLSEYSSFEEYLKKRWNISRNRGYRLIYAARSLKVLAPYYEPGELPDNESHIRPLTSLPEEAQVEIWQDIVESGDRSTANVQQQVKEFKICGAYPLIGSKWKLSKAIVEMAQDITWDRLLEPFAGSAAIFFRFCAEGYFDQDRTAILNDKNHLATTTFKVLRDRSEELTQAIALTPYSREELDGGAADEDMDDLEIARRWLASSYLGFVGRHDQKRFSVDHSERNYRAKKWGKLPDQIEPMAVALRKASIENLDALDFIKKYTEKRNNLLIVDPPYIGTESHYLENFDAHQELAEELREVPAAGVLATYYDTPEVRELYPETAWEWHLVDRSKSTGYTAQTCKEKQSEVVLKRRERVAVGISPVRQEKQSVAAPRKRAEDVLEVIRKELSPSEIDRLIELLRS